MRILVTNDDGIRAPYLAALAGAASALGEVTVIAPMEQCSAMSHRITLYQPMEMQRELNFPAAGVEAYRIDATPADCVKIAYNGLFEPGREPQMVG